MATGSQGVESSVVLRTLMVNTKGSCLEQSSEGVVDFYLVKIFGRRSDSPFLATRFAVKALLWVLLMRTKSGLSPMYKRFE